MSGMLSKETTFKKGQFEKSQIVFVSVTYKQCPDKYTSHFIHEDTENQRAEVTAVAS